MLRYVCYAHAIILVYIFVQSMSKYTPTILLAVIQDFNSRLLRNYDMNNIDNVSVTLPSVE